jgi:hypothetical protein
MANHRGCKDHRLRRFWNLLQDLGTEVQDFLSNRVKALLMAKFVFATGITCLDSGNAAPMWRNGRRNGLKIRSREKRGMGSNPIIGTSEKRFYEGKSIKTVG